MSHVFLLFEVMLQISLLMMAIPTVNCSHTLHSAAMSLIDPKQNRPTKELEVFVALRKQPLQLKSTLTRHQLFLQKKKPECP